MTILRIATFLVAVLVVAGTRSQAATKRDASLRGRTGTDTTFYQDVAWSPDGKRLLLSRLDIHENYRASIVVLNVDGTGYEQVTDGPHDMWATWSPGGSAIAFASTKNDNRDIYSMAMDRSYVIRLTDHPSEDTHPAWSPDGARIAFISDRSGESQVFLMKTDGSDQRQITRAAGEKWNPRWSPDGRRLVYYGASEAGKDSVYVMDTDGSNHITLGAGIWPSWSADGTRILFVDDDDVYEMDTSGANPTHVLEHAVTAKWSPDGSILAFIRVTWRAETGWPAMSDVFTLDPRTTKTRKLTGRE